MRFAINLTQENRKGYNYFMTNRIPSLRPTIPSSEHNKPQTNNPRIKNVALPVISSIPTRDQVAGKIFPSVRAPTAKPKPRVKAEKKEPPTLPPIRKDYPDDEISPETHTKHAQEVVQAMADLIKK